VRGRYSVVAAIGPRRDALRCDDMLRRGDDRRAVREWLPGRVIPATDISDSFVSWAGQPCFHWGRAVKTWMAATSAAMTHGGVRQETLFRDDLLIAPG
jgi:hypothetical protein